VSAGSSAVRWSALAGVVFASAVTRAQTPTFSVAVETVRVDVLVTDRHEPLLGLGADDFEVLDNGVVQKVELASFERLQLNVVLALDTSGSVTGRHLESLREASRAIVGDLKAGDRAALLTFSNALSVLTDLSGDVERVRAALDEASASGDTSLVDGTYAAVVIAESASGRGLVIVLSDGVDTASFLRPESVIETARRSDVVVYGVAVSRLRRSFVRELCAATGGRVLQIESTDEIRDAFLRVLEEFRHRYLLSYVPQGVPRAGWHSLKVRVKNRRATVEARPGYLAGP
jgi:Ca-activated chloride channel family protein